MALAGMELEERRVLGPNIMVDRLRSAEGSIDQVYMPPNADPKSVDAVIKNVENEARKREEAKVEERRALHAARPNECLWSYEIVEAGDASGVYERSGERRNEAPVYRHGRFSLSRELLPTSEGELQYGWVLGILEQKKVLYGVQTDSLSAPGEGWITYDDDDDGGDGDYERRVPYVARWTTVADAIADKKTSGNVCFKRKQFEQAIAAYAEGLRVSEEEGNDAHVAALHANRAECRLRLGDAEGALSDAESAIAKATERSLLEKCHARRARAARHLGMLKVAADAYAAALEVASDASKPELEEALREVKTLASADKTQELRDAQRCLELLGRGEFRSELVLPSDRTNVSEPVRRLLRARRALGLFLARDEVEAFVVVRRLLDDKLLATTAAAAVLKEVATRVRAALGGDDARAVYHAVHLLDERAKVPVGDEARLATVAMSTPKQLKLRPDTCRFTRAEWTSMQRVACRVLATRRCAGCPIVPLLSSPDEKIALAGVALAQRATDEPGALDLVQSIVSKPGELATYSVGATKNIAYYKTDRLDETSIARAAAALVLVSKVPDNRLQVVTPLLHAPPAIARQALRLLSTARDDEALARLGAHRPLLGLDSPTPDAPLPTCVRKLFSADKAAVRDAAALVARCASVGALDADDLDDRRALESLEAMFEENAEAVATALARFLAKGHRCLMVDLRFFENGLVPTYRSSQPNSSLRRALSRCLRRLLSFEDSISRLAAAIDQRRGNHDVLLHLTSEIACDEELATTHYDTLVNKSRDPAFSFVDVEAKVMSLQNFLPRLDVIRNKNKTCAVLEIGRLAGIVPGSTVLEPCAPARDVLANQGHAILAADASRAPLSALASGCLFDVVLFADARDYVHPDWHVVFTDIKSVLSKTAFLLILDDADVAFVVGDDAAQAGFVEDDLSSNLVALPDNLDLLIFRPEDQTADFAHLIHATPRPPEPPRPATDRHAGMLDLD